MTAQDDDPALYRTEVRFNAIYVLESLPTEDPKTGRDLYDEVIYPGTLRLDGLQTAFYRVNNSHDLARSIAEVARAVHHSGRVPILHIEAHGYEGGIALADGTEVPWRELVPMLGDINRACRMNLIVVAIACMGWSLMRDLMIHDRAPLFMLVAPPSTMRADDLLEATRQFYDAVFTHLDVNKSLEAMNLDLPFDQWRLKPGTAEILFCRVFRDHVARGGTFHADAETENALVAKFVRRWDLSINGAALARDFVRRDFGDLRWWYGHLRERFLWMDVFPEDKARFGLSYDICFEPPG